MSASGDDGEEMTIGKVMDWIEARLEAIKSSPEEEEEDRERLKEGTSLSKASEDDTLKEEKRDRKASGGGVHGLSKSHRRSKENLQGIVLPSQLSANNAQQAPSSRQTSASSPPRSFTSPSPTPPPIRPIRSKRGLKDFNNNNNSDLHHHHHHHHHLPLPVSITSNAVSSPFTFSPDVVSTLPPVGHKRRHAVMLAESPGSSSAGSTPTSNQLTNHSHAHTHGSRRKRGRGTRDVHHGQQGAVVTGNVSGNGNVSQAQACADAMEVEEDGRERKRVARR